MVRGVDRVDVPSARADGTAPAPILRALATGWLVVALAASAHRMGGCEVPGAVTLAGCAAVVALISVRVGLLRTPTFGQSVSVMLGAQLALHVLFETAARAAHYAAAAASSMPGGVPRPGMVVNVAAVLLGTFGNLPDQVPMLAGHGLATLVLAWWLCAGERQLMMTVALGRQRLLEAYALAAPRVRVEQARLRRLPWHDLAIHTAQRPWATTVGRRGPPLAASPA